MSSIKPRKPQRGERVLQSLYDSVCQIIDFLPSLQIVGDNKTIKIDSFGSGKTISAIKPNKTSLSTSKNTSKQVFLGIVIEQPKYLQAVKVQLSNDGGLSFTGEVIYTCLTNISINSKINVGTIVIVYMDFVVDIGGSEHL